MDNQAAIMSGACVTAAGLLIHCPLSIAPFVARDRLSEGTFTAQDGLPG